MRRILRLRFAKPVEKVGLGPKETDLTAFLGFLYHRNGDESDAEKLRSEIKERHIAKSQASPLRRGSLRPHRPRHPPLLRGRGRLFVARAANRGLGKARAKGVPRP